MAKEIVRGVDQATVDNVSTLSARFSRWYKCIFVSNRSGDWRIIGYILDANGEVTLPRPIRDGQTEPVFVVTSGDQHSVFFLLENQSGNHACSLLYVFTVASNEDPPILVLT